ncbi:MAG: sulfite exporter TauE/SafE family protein [Oscillospiraceae bacterium]|nr:sulfite exporter TauE/SafE family protein [Oscillospiraceae bacterium]
MYWLVFATLVAFFVKGLCGFANTLVFTSILGFTTDNINISPVEIVLGYPSNAILAWRERKHLNFKVWLPLALMVLSGSIPGVFLLKNIHPKWIKITFGFAVIAMGVEMLLRNRIKQQAAKSTTILFIIGIVSGVLCGIYGVGALLAAYVSRVTTTSNSFKANLCLVFLIENTFRIVLYLITGIITLHTVQQAFILLPVMLLGLYLGIKSGSFLNESVAKKVVIVVLIISGAALIINNL